MDYEQQAQFMEIKPKFRGVLTRPLTEALCAEEFDYPYDFNDDSIQDRKGFGNTEVTHYLTPFS